MLEPEATAVPLAGCDLTVTALIDIPFLPSFVVGEMVTAVFLGDYMASLFATGAGYAFSKLTVIVAVFDIPFVVVKK